MLKTSALLILLSTVSGKVTNGPHVTVQLDQFRNGLQTSSRRTLANGNGSYTFQNVKGDSSLEYQVKAFKNDVAFSSNRFSIQKASVTVPRIDLKDISGDLAQISAEQIVLIEYGPMNILKVSHSFAFENRGHVAFDFRAAEKKPLEFSIPDSAFDFRLSPETSEDSVQIANGKNAVQFHLTIPPKSELPKKVEFSYMIHTTQKSLPIQWTPSFFVSRVTLASVDKKLNLKSTFFTHKPRREKDGRVYDIYSGEGALAMQPIAIELKGLPLTSDLGHYILFGALILVVILAGGLFLLTKPAIHAKRSSSEWASLWMDELEKIEGRYQSREMDLGTYEASKQKIREILFDLTFNDKNKAKA